MVKSTCASSSGLAPLKRQNAFWYSIEHRFFSAERIQQEAVTGKEKVYQYRALVRDASGQAREHRDESWVGYIL